MSAAAATPDEVRIAERYLPVLADISRCAQAIRDGDWQQLAGTADELCRRAALLAEVAGKVTHTQPAPRGEIVAAVVTARNDSSPAARLLHPTTATTMPRTALTDPFTHPDHPTNPSR